MRTAWTWVLAGLGLAGVACGGEELGQPDAQGTTDAPGLEVADSGAADATADGALDDAADATADGAPDAATDLGADPDPGASDAIEDAPSETVADVTPDAVPDVPSDDVTPGEVDVAELQETVSGDGGDDAGPPACVDCSYLAQPPAPHPGGPGPHALAPAQTLSYGSGFGAGYKKVLVLRPDGPGPWPVFAFGHGKQLASGGGFTPELGLPYRALLEHVASHGYVVVYPAVEQSAFDADHRRMADDFLDALSHVLASVPEADADRVAFGGHSMGAKVALIAAAKAIAQDADDALPDPEAVLLFAISNEPPPVGAFQDARDEAEAIAADAPVWFTFVQAHDDAIAPYLDPGKPNALALYEALAPATKQVVVLHGTGPGDPNPPTDPPLADDHSAPLTVEGKPGGLADFAMPDSHLDALDWYGYWKLTVGALDHHFAGGDPAWAYGALRTHGGELPGGGVVTHEVKAQGF